jgi:hypothetical protein
MKFLLIHDGGDPKTVKRLRKLFKQYEKTVDECIPGEAGEGLVPVLESLSGGCGMLLHLSGSSLPPWAHVIAGYTLALKAPLLVYGMPPESFGAPLARHLVPIKTGDELAAYLRREAPEYFARVIRDRVKYELLEMGIPFSEEALAGCVMGENKRAVALFLDAGYSPNTRDGFGVPLLNLAVRMGHRHLVKLLLKAGADLNGQAEDRLSTALMDAVSGQHHGIVKDLLTAGADINLKSRDGQSALVVAVGLNDETSAELLLRAGARADEPDMLGASARKYAGLFNKPAMLALFERYAPLTKNAG